MKRNVLYLLTVALISCLFNFYSPNILRVEAAGFTSSSFYKGLQNTAVGTGHITDSSAKPKSAIEVIGQVVQVILSFLGVIFLILMIYGGYLWMLASGNEQQIDKAKNLIKSAIAGLVIVLLAYIITAFVGNAIMGSVNSE